MPLAPLLGRYDQLILDLDGCVWVGDSPVDGSVEAIGALRAAGKRVAFVTNESRHAGEDLVRKLWGLGVKASLGDVVTSGGAMQHLLAETRTGRTAFVIGTEALMRNVEGAGLKVLNGTDLASRAEVVVVAGTFDLRYEDLRDATLALRRGADFLATSRDPTYPAADGMWPGTGAILAAVETAAERTAAIVGKPEPQVFFTALERLGEGRTLVVGDRLDSDIAAAAKAKLESALVLTGGVTRDALGVKDEAQPDHVAESLSALVTG